MASKVVSQRSSVALKNVLDVLVDRGLDVAEKLYENDFPDWFIAQANRRHSWRWVSILVDLKRGTFFFDRDAMGRTGCIVGPGVAVFGEAEALSLGEFYVQKLAAFAVAFSPRSREATLLAKSLAHLLQLDGFDVDKAKLKLVPLEGPVSAQEEEDRLTTIVKNSGLPQSPVILKHIEDAYSLCAEGKDRPSLNESRSLIQALIDGISTETNTHGKHSTKLPGGTGNRIKYLKDVGFFTPDEETAYGAGWGTLSAGSHPGVPTGELARIGLILALEFGQLLLIKFANWKANAYRTFS